MGKIRLTFAGLITVPVLACSVGGCSVAGYDISIDHDYLPGSSAFSINGASCPASEAKLYLSNYKNLYGTAYGLDLWDYTYDGVSLQDYVKSVTIDELSRIYCMEQIAREQGISLEDSDRAYVSKAAEVYFASLSGAEVDYMGIDRDSLEEYYARYALADKLYRTMTDGETEEVSDDDARVIRLRQILVRQEERAKEVEEQLAAGKDFSSVANSFNEAEETELTVARGQLAKELEEVAFNLDNGEVSKRLKASGGYYFLQCVSKYEEKLTEANKEVLLAKRREQRFTDVYSGFVERSEHELDERFWDEAAFVDEGAVTTDSFFSTYEEISAGSR